MAIIITEDDHELININGQLVFVRYHEEEKKAKEEASFRNLKNKLKDLSEETREFYFGLFDKNSNLETVQDDSKIDFTDIEPEFREILTNIYKDAKDLSLIKYAEIYSYYLNQLRDWKSLKLILQENKKITFLNWYDVYVKLNVSEEIERYFDIVVDSISTQRNIDVHLFWVEKQKKNFLTFLNNFFAPKFFLHLENEWKIQYKKYLDNHISEKASGPRFNIVDEV